MLRTVLSRRSGAAVSLALALGACQATDYAKPIATFADATTAASAALHDLDTAATDTYAQRLAERARSDLSLVVTMDKDDCRFKSARCRIVLVSTASPAEPPQPYPPDPVLGDMLVVMDEVHAYAQNLAAVVADDSATQAQASAAAAVASAQTLANTVAALDKKGTITVPDFATPVGPAVSWLVGTYANEVKLRALRGATAKADPVIQRAALLFGDAAFLGTDIQRSDLSAAARKKIDAFSHDRGNDAKLADAVAAARAYDDLLTAKPVDTFKKMGEAHAALTKALNDPDLSLSSAIAAIESFAQQAQQLSAVAKALAALNAKPPEASP